MMPWSRDRRSKIGSELKTCTMAVEFIGAPGFHDSEKDPRFSTEDLRDDGRLGNIPDIDR
jgi:hypothetical protein